MPSTSQQSRFFQRSWTGTAFLIEALVLLIFVAGTLAVLLNVFARSYEVGSQSQDEARAISVATNAAEVFSAAPAEGVFVSVEGDFVTNCVVDAEKTSAGTMYHATISVYPLHNVTTQEDTPVTALELAPVLYDSAVPAYTLTTARYVSGEVS